MNPIQIDFPTKRVNVVTLGCSKNTVDSEALMGLLRKNSEGSIKSSLQESHF